MRYSKSFTKTLKTSKEYDSVNATLLIKGGFVDQTMAGVYSFLPLGWRVLNKIEDIVRAEMDKIGQEVLMPAIVPKDLWETTERIDSVDVLFKAVPANKISKDKNDNEYVLSSTHEEVVTPIAKKFNVSYKDLPFAVYQIQTKFRNEARPKSGLMRGREFRMKDLYSFHKSEEDLLAFYKKAKQAYTNVFKMLGIGEDTFYTAASGGDFTKDNSHEFQTKVKTGEDTVFVHPETGEYLNKEIVSDEDQKKFESFNASEVGNIFPLNTKFSKAFNYKYTDEKGDENLIYMGSYGIGTSRVMGVIAEKFYDEKGLVWPKQVAPYDVYLVDIKHSERAEEVYNKLQEAGIEVLWDDRDVNAGEKFSDADLIGIPVRLVVSERNGDKIEFKYRSSENSEILTLDEVIKKIENE